MNNEELWKTALGELELSISKANFETWFSNTAILSKENGKVFIGVRSIFTKEWLENRYNHIILQAIQKHDPSIREISCSLQQDISNDTTPTHSHTIHHQIPPTTQHESTREYPQHTVVPAHNITSPESQTSTFSHNSFSVEAKQHGTIPASATTFTTATSIKKLPVLNPRYTFENFIVGENNELARAACFAVSQSPGALYNPLFIYGVVGVGKTHLIQAIGNEVLRNSPEKIIHYTTSERFTNELIENLKNQTMNDFKIAYQEIDILLIDDVQFLSGREKTQQEFFHIFNNLYQINKQIVITSDRTPKAIPTLEDRLKSRFEGGMIADISRPDLETRMAILRLKLIEKGITMNEECVRFIAENITNNIRELEGALNRVLISSEFQKIHPTVPYITKILGQIITTNKQSVTMETITSAVAEFYNVPEEELAKKGRKKEVAFARQIAMYLARTELSLSLSGIGKHFGGRDHTTVLHAFERIQKSINTDGRFKEEIISLRERLYQA